MFKLRISITFIQGCFSTVLAQEADLKKLNERLSIDLRLAERVPISDDYWYETYQLPKPDNYDELIARREEQRRAALEAVSRSGKDDNEKPGKKEKLGALSGFFA
ncbi:MAG: hypothetical protein ACI3Z7_06665 [Candidatus Aphodosoma sp.]